MKYLNGLGEDGLEQLEQQHEQTRTDLQKVGVVKPEPPVTREKPAAPASTTVTGQTPAPPASKA